MPYRGIQLTPRPTNELPGDIFPIDLLSGTVVQIRGVTVIQTWSVSFPGVLLGDVPPIPVPSNDFQWLVYFEGSRRMITKTITSVSEDVNGVVTFGFSDGGSRPLAAGHAEGRQIRDNYGQDSIEVENLAIGLAYVHAPDGTALSDCIGLSVTVDINAAVPAMVTKPVGMQ